MAIPTSALRDARRLIDARDVLCGMGTFIYKRSLRYSVLALCFGLLGYMAGRVGLPGLSKTQALGLPCLVGFTALVTGIALKCIPNIIFSRLVKVAQAADLNLMEDYRKSLAARHLERLWDRVFRHEADLRYTEEEKQAERALIAAERTRIEAHLAGLHRDTLTFLGNPPLVTLVDGLVHAMPLSGEFEKTMEGFLISASFAHRHWFAQLTEEHMTGLNLSLFDDWCDGACFDASDTKLMEQYLGNPTLAAIKREFAWPLAHRMRGVAARMSQRLWFGLVTRAVATRVGLAVKTLNAWYGTTRFNAQLFLWPGSEDDPFVASLPGARARILALRRELLERIMGDGPAHGDAVIARMFWCTLAFAAELRMRYDPDWCDGTLGYTVLDEIGTLPPHARAGAERFAARAAQHLALLADWLAARRPETAADPLLRRAVRVHFHIDKKGFKHAVLHDMDRAQALVDAACDAVDAVNRRLVTLRQFHELCRMQLESYGDLVRALWRTGE